MPLVTFPFNSETVSEIRYQHQQLIDTADYWANFLEGSLSDLATAIAAPVVPDIETEITVALPLGWGSPWEAPTIPASPTFTVTPPTVPTLDEATPPDAFEEGTPPTFDIALGDAPGAAPDVVVSDVTDLAALSLPALSVTVPAIELDEVVAAWSWTDSPYAGHLDTALESRLSSVLNGDALIDDGLFDAAYDKAASDMAAVYRADLWAVSDLAGMRGEMPTETLLVGMDKVQGDYSKGLSRVRLEQSLARAQQRLGDLWKAVEKGIPYEQMWQSFHVSNLGRTLQAATAAVEAEVAVYNANVARWTAILRAVEANTALSAEERQRALTVIEDHRERLAHQEQRLRAKDRELVLWGEQWKGYTSQASAEATVFSERVRNFLAGLEERKARVTSSAEAGKFTLEANSQKVQIFTAQWEGVKAEASALLAQIQALTAPAELQIKSEAGRLSAENQQLDLAVRNAQLTQAAEIEKAKLLVSQVQYLAGLNTKALSEISNVAANTMGAYLSAGDTSLSASASTSESASNSGGP